jgi:uncharacterized protein
MALTATSTPAAVGIGLRSSYLSDFLSERLPVSCSEIHAENCFVNRPWREAVAAVAARLPVFVHGVGASLGSASRPDRAHLRSLRALIDELKPPIVSEHLAWCRVGGRVVPDLLPVPFTPQVLETVARNVEEAQDVIGRRLSIENPSMYLRIDASTMPEAHFLSELAARTGCGLLLDVNNVIVTANNTGISADVYFDGFDFSAVDQIHLAGHSREQSEATTTLIDTHGAAISHDVWELFSEVYRRIGRPIPTLIERDQQLPQFAELVGEAQEAMRRSRAALARHQHERRAA